MKNKKEKEGIFSVILFVEFLLLYNFISKFWIFFAFILITLIFGVIKILELKVNKETILKNIHFFILPIMYFLGVIFFLPVIQNKFIQTVLLAVYSLSNLFLYEGIRKLKSYRDRPLIISRNIVSMIGLVVVFLLITDITNAITFYNLPIYFMMILIFISVWLVTYFLYWQYRDIEKDSLIYISLISFVVMELSWASSFWITSYPSYIIGTLGVPVFAIISLIVYYCFWGIAHHKIENNLTKKVLLEYLMISISIIAIILLTTNWISKGIAT